MAAAYLNAPPMPTISALTICAKIPYSRKEAERLVRGRSPHVNGRSGYKIASFNPHGINAYCCDICGNGVWHTGHLPVR